MTTARSAARAGLILTSTVLILAAPSAAQSLPALSDPIEVCRLLPVDRDIAWEVTHELITMEANRIVVDERSGGLLTFIAPLKTLGVDVAVTLLLIPRVTLRSTVACAVAHGTSGRSPFYIGNFFRELEKRAATRTDQSATSVDLKQVPSVYDTERVEPLVGHAATAEARSFDSANAALPFRLFPGFSYERVWRSSVLILMQHGIITSGSFREGVLFSGRPSKLLNKVEGSTSGKSTVVFLKPTADGVEVAVAWNCNVVKDAPGGMPLSNRLSGQDDTGGREFLGALAAEVFATDKWSGLLGGGSTP